MYPDNKEESKEAVRNDPRITPVGVLLRKLSLDEFPQFINVLRGDMSVVGPRPHMFSQTLQYQSTHNRYPLRQSIKPGITGLAQVKGYRGEIKSPRALKNRVRLDVFYLLKWSFGLDILIIIKSIRLVLFGDKNAY